MLRKSLYRRHHIIERCLRVVDGLLQCDVVRLQLADLLVLLGIPPIFLRHWELFDSSTSLFFATFYFLPTETLFLLDFAQKLRQAASVNEPIFVGVENHRAVINATNMILDFAIIVFHSQSLQMWNFEMKAPIA